MGEKWTTTTTTTTAMHTCMRACGGTGAVVQTSSSNAASRWVDIGVGVDGAEDESENMVRNGDGRRMDKG